MNNGLTIYGTLVENHPTRVLAKAALNGAPPEIAKPIQAALKSAREACLQKNKTKAVVLHNATIANLTEVWSVLDLHGPDEELACMAERAIEWHRAAVQGAPAQARRRAEPREPGTPVPPRAGRPRGPQDETAKALVGLTLEQMYQEASEVLGVPAADLKEKYKHLNPGLQRMNLGNRMRKVMLEKTHE